MQRFFSKLDLRDIKIDPETTRFPPEADDPAAREVPAAEAQPDEHRPDTAHHADEHALAVAPTTPTVVPVRAPFPFDDPMTRLTNSHLFEDPEPSVPADGTDAEADATGVATAESAGDAAGERTTPSGVDVLKVSARSRPSAVAGAIAGVVREAGRAEVQAIGAGATNQAVKAVAIARDYLRATGIEAICLPAFIDVTVQNEDRTAILLVVEPR